MLFDTLFILWDLKFQHSNYLEALVIANQLQIYNVFIDNIDPSKLSGPFLTLLNNDHH